MTKAAADGMGADRASVAEIFDLFQCEGWGETQRYVGSKYTVHIMINGAGKAVLREYGEKSRARGRQVNACADALLDWLYEHDGQGVSSSDFATDPRANYLGEPFDASIIREAAKSLKDQGVTTGTGTMQGVMLRMNIAPAGRDIVDAFDSDVRAWRTRELTGRQGDVNVRVDGSSAVTVAVHSLGASQTATVITTDHRTQIIGLADAFKQTLPVLGLAGGDQEQAEQLILELRQIGQEDEPEPGRIRKLLDGVKSMAVAGTGNAAGTGIVALSEQIAQNWPL